MDSSNSSVSTAADSEQNNVTIVQSSLEELFKAMHGGWFTKWADEHLSDDVVFIELGLLAEGNRTFNGRQEICEFYNKVLSTVWGLQSMVSWTPECVVAGSEKGQVQAIMRQVVVQPGDQETIKRKSYDFNVNNEGKLTFLCCKILNVVSATFQPASAPVFERPCCHNDWDSIRVKRKLCQLRCRVCLSQWKLRSENVHRCPVFVEPGCNDLQCELLHINKKKLRVAMQYDQSSET